MQRVTAGIYQREDKRRKSPLLEGSEAVAQVTFPARACQLQRPVMLNENLKSYYTGLQISLDLDSIPLISFYIVHLYEIWIMYHNIDLDIDNIIDHSLRKKLDTIFLVRS